MLGQLGKDLYNAQHRILDHRVFVQGEIEYFLDNFELKRDEVEVETLFRVTEGTGELKYELSERCQALATAHLGALSDQVQSLLKGVNVFLTETNLEKSPSTRLIEARQQRAAKLEQFKAELQHRYERLDNSFEEKEEEISELYSDLELKLNIPK